MRGNIVTGSKLYCKAILSTLESRAILVNQYGQHDAHTLNSRTGRFPMMDASVQWLNSTTDQSYIARIKLQSLNSTCGNPLSTKSPPEDAGPNPFHVESFCTTKYHINATYDSNPLTSLRIIVIIPQTLRKSGNTVPRAQKLSYTPVCSNKSTPSRDCLFASLDAFSSAASIFLTLEEVIGVHFRIELDDSSYLKQFDGSEFFVGLGKRRIPYCLEMPLSWPLSQQIQSERVLSLYRSNLFWLQPQLDNRDLHQLLHETNFVLVGLGGDNTNQVVNGYACMMVTRDQKLALRSTLFSTGTYAAIRVETSCEELPSVDDLADVVVCHLAVGADPYSAVRTTIEAHSLQRRTFSSRSRKLSSSKWQTLSAEAKILTRLGYCTWDAVGHKCSEEYVLLALKWLEKKKVPVGYVVIDDGWQDGGSSGPLSEYVGCDEPSPKLASFRANEKFPSSLRRLSPKGKPTVYVWMTVIGYWGGIDGTCLQKDTTRISLRASIGLHRNQPNQTRMWEREYEITVPTTEKVELFFVDYFTTLSTQGVKCVKIDGQSLLGSFTICNRHFSGLVGKYRDALYRAAEEIFPGEVILNSMSCAHEILLHSGTDISVTNACWRTSDDHAFPGLEETDGMVVWHVLRNAMNGLFVGEIFPVTDWDMFRVSDKNAYMHAVARVLSGGPVYISDAIPFDDEFGSAALLLVQRLTTSYGRILRCHDPGRPTADCLFGDPRHGRMFKVFNRNAVSGMVGLFNLGTRETGHAVREEYCAGDVEDFRRGPSVRFISVVVGGAWRCAFFNDSSCAKQAITLRPMEAAIAHIYPILLFPGDLEVAPIGRLDLLNCGGVVKSVSAWKSSDEENIIVEVSLADYGRVAIWLGHKAILRLTNVTACDEQQDITFLEIDDLSLLSVTVPEAKEGQEILLQMTFSKNF